MNLPLDDTAYRSSASDNLARAEALLGSGSVAGLLYAALEIRLGTERRQAEYAEHWDSIPKKAKREWRADAIGRALDDAFNLRDRVVRVIQVQFADPQPITFIYTPVSARLIQVQEQLGAYLHAKGWAKADDKGEDASVEWRRRLHGLVVEGIAHLKVAMMGNLMGPAMRDTHREAANPGRGYVQLITVVDDELRARMLAERAEADRTGSPTSEISVSHFPIAQLTEPTHDELRERNPFRFEWAAKSSGTAIESPAPASSAAPAAAGAVLAAPVGDRSA